MSEAGGPKTGGDLPVQLKARYVPIQSLGRGGMGLVVRARDHELRREVALKVMLSVPGEAALDRFHREAALLARVEHPGVVRVFDFGVQGEKPYLVMELLDGASLDKLEEAVGLEAVAVGTAEALDAVHAAGLVHRDVKPGNLFRCRDGRLVLTDFGLSHDPAQTRLTATGEIGGTGAYLAPEAWAGEAPTPAWDWWALGITLYKLAEGHVPYGLGELTGAAAGAPLLRPSFQRLEARNVRKLIRGLLEPDPTRRLAGAAAVARHFGSEADGSGLQDAVSEDLGMSTVGWGSSPGSAATRPSPALASTDPAPTGAPARWGWRGMFLAGLAGSLLATAPWWATSSPPAPLPPSPPPPEEPAWAYPFPRDLDRALLEELRALEGLVVGRGLAVAPGEPREEIYPLLDPDPLYWWEVARRLPALQAAVSWVADSPAATLGPEVLATLARADEALAGQALLPAFRVAREPPPVPMAPAPWAEVAPSLAAFPEFDDELPAGPWLRRACEAYDRAEEVLAARRQTYTVIGEGGPMPDAFPRVLASTQTLAWMPFREQLRRGFYDRDLRRDLGEWLAPAPQEVERCIWALGRAADAGREAAAVKVARRLLSRVDEVASPRLLVTPPWVWLGRRATTPEGQLLALEVSWVGGSERSRVGLPAFTPEDLEQVRALRQAGSQESWTTSLAVAHQLGMLGELKRSPDRVRLLVEVSAWALDPARPVWPAIEVLASGASALRKPELDGLWGPELAARLEAFLARPEVLRDESGEIQRSNFGDLVAARRERDPGFEFRSAFE